MSRFEQQLRELVNCFSMENGSNTPDGVLARFLVDSLFAFDVAVRERERLGPSASSQDRVAVLAAQVHELETKLEHLTKGYGTEMYETEEQLALALGMTYGEYGYPVGDHTPASLAAEVRQRLVLAEAERDRLRQDLAATRAEFKHTVDKLTSGEQAMAQTPVAVVPPPEPRDWTMAADGQVDNSTEFRHLTGRLAIWLSRNPKSHSTLSAYGYAKQIMSLLAHEHGMAPTRKPWEPAP